MIKSIAIKNFRTHQNTILELTDGVNCLVGGPDSGKTNIIRGLLWALTNRPLGFRFHSDIAQDADTSVKIDFKEDQWIELSKNKKAANYTTSIDKEPLKAIGQDVPDSVSSIANMSELNIQKQLDRHFLICSTPAEVAKVFNRITRLEKIDKTVSLLTTDINSCNKEIKQVSEAIVDLQNQVDAIGDLSEMELECKAMIEYQDQIAEIESNQEVLQDKINSIVFASTSMQKYQGVEKASIGFQAIEKLQDDLQALEEESNDLELFVQALESAAGKYKALEKYIKNISVDYELLQSQLTAIESHQDEIGELQEHITDVERMRQAMTTVRDRRNAELQVYKAFLATIKICPFCDQCKAPLEKHDFNLFLKEFEI
jgi:chromosome segregation ATPase